MSEIRQTLRSILRRPAFALTAILTVALGIGANVAVFAIIHAVLLEPLPFREPKQLVQVWETHPELHNVPVSVPDYLDWKKSAKTLDLAAYTFQSMDKATLIGQGDPIAVQGTNASSALFPLLGIKPIIGRVYSSEQENQAVILISEQLWRRKFSADPHVVGRALHLNSISFTIIGVLARRSSFPVWADVWMPFSQIEPELYSTRKYHPLEVVGRLKPGVSLRQAELELENTARHLSSAYPATNGKIGAFAVPLMDTVIGGVRPALITTWMLVGLVLLIACANLAHLMMSRALNRQHEIALRLALGASRLSAFRTFLLEALLLSLGGGLLGILAANLALPWMQHLANGQIPRLDDVTVDSSVLLFGILACFLLAVLFVIPAYGQVLLANLNDVISSGTTRTTSAGRSWPSRVLMGSEVAFALTVVLAATTLIRSFSLALHVDPGFNAKNVVCLRSPLVEDDWKRSYVFFNNNVVPALTKFSAIREVAAVNALPMSLGTTEHSRFVTRFGIAGREFVPGQFPVAQSRWCTPNYFHVLGIPLIRGRLLTAADYNRPIYLINEALARRFFPNSNPVGQKLIMGVVSPQPELGEIAGVVGNVREFGVTSAPEPAIYSIDVSPEMDLAMMIAGSTAAVEEFVPATMRRINPRQAIGPIQPLSAFIRASLIRQQFILTLITAFAAVAICLCAVGIYGVFSYSVARRMREFGIRSAVGARGADLMTQVIRECLIVIFPGVIAGVGISIACSGFMRTLLYQISPTDLVATTWAVITVLAGCLLSVLTPSWRAARADPAHTLREQ
jgi:putative ABC transport system permease protein